MIEAAITVRPLLHSDLNSLASLDTSFETDVMYEVNARARGVDLVERSVSPPLSKAYAVD